MSKHLDPSHTLAGVLSLLQATRTPAGVGVGVVDQKLAAELDRAFAKHIPKLRQLCGHELRGFPEAEIDEVVQDVLLEAWGKIQLPEYRPERSFLTYLWAIATKKCANLRRKRRDLLTEDGLFNPQSNELSVLSRLEAEQRDGIVAEAAQALESADQEVVHLRWVLDCSHEEIAEQLGLDSDRVRVALQRCRRQLAKEIQRILDRDSIGQSILREGPAR